MKKITSSVLGLTLAGVMALMLPARVHAQAPQYTVTILSGLGGSDGSTAYGINASGQVVGNSWTAGNAAQDAVVWNGTTPTVLSGLGGSDGSTAIGINASGQVVGYSWTAGNAAQDAVVWNGTTPTLLDSEGGTTSVANGINDSGQVVGYSVTHNDTAHYAVVWNGTTPTVLGSVAGSSDEAYGINASGQVVGYSNGAHDAVVWNGTTPTVLSSGSTNNTAFSINATGQVVGLSNQNAVEWNGATPTVIATDSEAGGINDSGQVVGDNLSSPQDGFLYTGGTYYNLNDIVVPGSGFGHITVNGSGDPINDLGQIAADDNGVALLLTPTPEPSATMLILGSGLMWIASRRYRSAI